MLGRDVTNADDQKLTDVHGVERELCRHVRRRECPTTDGSGAYELRTVTDTNVFDLNTISAAWCEDHSHRSKWNLRDHLKDHDRIGCYGLRSEREHGSVFIAIGASLRFAIVFHRAQRDHRPPLKRNLAVTAMRRVRLARSGAFGALEDERLGSHFLGLRSIQYPIGSPSWSACLSW